MSLNRVISPARMMRCLSRSKSGLVKIYLGGPLMVLTRLRYSCRYSAFASGRDASSANLSAYSYLDGYHHMCQTPQLPIENNPNITKMNPTIIASPSPSPLCIATIILNQSAFPRPPKSQLWIGLYHGICIHD